MFPRKPANLSKQTEGGAPVSTIFGGVALTFERPGAASNMFASPRPHVALVAPPPEGPVLKTLSFIRGHGADVRDSG